MRIVFDLQALQNASRSRGIGRYVRQLFIALSTRRDIELIGLLNSSFEEHLQEEIAFVSAAIGRDHVITWQPAGATCLIGDNHTQFNLSERIYEDILRSMQFDVLLVGSLFEGFGDNTITSLKGAGNYKRFAILYDLIPLIYAEKFLGWDKIHAWYHDRITHLRAANGLLAISQSARSEALQLIDFEPSQIVAIGTATDTAIFNSRVPLDPTVLSKLGIKRPFVMHASAIDPRKNFDGLIKAYALLPDGIRNTHQLVLIGHGDQPAVEALKSLSRELGLSADQIVIAGHIDDHDLVQLYRHCALFVFPSFHEGFGLPALEAMSCGCATIGSNRSSIPEVIGDAELLFDPDDVDSISSAILSVIGCDERRQEIAAHGLKHSRSFRWTSIASKAVRAMRTNRVAGNPTFPSVEASLARILGDGSLPRLNPAEAADFATAAVFNEAQLIRYASAPRGKKQQSWRIEGPFDSSYSLALLNRETARALDAIGYDVSLHSTEGPGDFDPNPYYLDMHPDLQRFHKRSIEQSHPDCDIVSRILYPPRVDDMHGKINALHHYAWEETGFPQEWVAHFNESLTLMTCLSRHVEKIMVDNGVTVPVVTSGCGVDHWDRVESNQSFTVSAKAFRFLHVSSCFPRKGAELMLDAYSREFTAQDDVTLIIKTFENPHNKIGEYLNQLQRDNPRFPDVKLIVDDLSEEQLKRLYELCDVLVGPSFAEGFGLPFAEAMLSGLPVITVNWGGQLDFCTDANSWLVDYAFDWAETHFGVWSSAWARVNLTSLADAMRAAVRTSKAERDRMADLGRRQLLKNNSWIHVAERLSAAVQILPAIRHDPSPIRIGLISTWGTRCGIAGYSEHLTTELGLPVIIFAPKNEEHSADPQNVSRCWSIGKEGCGLYEIAQAAVDVFLLQFNYGFYNHEEVGQLIRSARQLGKKVIITLHSTVDPPEIERAPEFSLALIKSELALCDRLLVHSIHDMNRLKELGLVENVMLFPHGVLCPELPVVARSTRQKHAETVTTYGFALPNKGLEEVIEAIALLDADGRPVRLLLNNAEYPAVVSADVISTLKSLAARLNVAHLVDQAHAYVSDEDSIGQIRKADLAIFAYQKTGESASGAVRFGLAAGIPVVVTPLPIFDDLRDAVFRLKGISPRDIAAGIASALDHVKTNSDVAVHVAERASDWRRQHSYAIVGKRLANLCTALARR